MSKIAISFINYLFCFGMTWIFAGIFQPDLASGTVWFIGALLGMMVNALNRDMK